MAYYLNYLSLDKVVKLTEKFFNASFTDVSARCVLVAKATWTDFGFFAKVIDPQSIEHLLCAKPSCTKKCRAFVVAWWMMQKPKSSIEIQES